MRGKLTEAAIAGYGAAATPELVARYNAIPSARLYHHVRDLFPTRACDAVDLGAGTGRDAAWLASQGHRVVAVEPVAALREAGRDLHQNVPIEWIDDRLPEVVLLGDRRFMLLIVSAVWQHLDIEQRAVAMTRVRTLALPNATLILSLRHGPASPGRPVMAIDDEATIELAYAARFSLLRRVEAESIQPSNIATGVRWTWLALMAVVC